jgi:hypothetical protein
VISAGNDYSDNRARRAPDSPAADLFLVHAQRFDIVPQLPPTGLGESNKKGSYPEPPTGMHLLRRARRADGSIGISHKVSQLRTLVDLVPSFWKQENR